jgi:hypothetical protein
MLSCNATAGPGDASPGVGDDAVPFVSNIADHTDHYSFQLAAKAEPDEFFNGVGMKYIPLGKQRPGLEGQPKVNHDYVWGMTAAGDHVWFATAGNVAGGFGARVLAEGPVAKENHVLEGPESRYPIRPKFMRNFIGDWRPPKIHRYNIETGEYEDITPDDCLINRTLGLRSAGANHKLVLFAGPSIIYTGMNVFAFNAKTGEYLGSKRIARYTDIRDWVNVNGSLYAGVSRTIATHDSEGAVIRWKGTVRSPFRFVEVGRLDLEGANLAEHEGRLYVSTWPINLGSLTYNLGLRSEELAGIWMSPELGERGLKARHRFGWQKVWDVSEYEPDPVIAGTLLMGPIESFDGHLYWGTMQLPGSGATELVRLYPDDGLSVGAVFPKALRGTALFRGDEFDRPHEAHVELLFGDDQLWTYTHAGQDPVAQPGQFTLEDNLMGPATFGQAGYRIGPFDPYQPHTIPYTWSMAVQGDQLYVGTYDFSVSTYSEVYIAAGGDVDLAEQIMAEQFGMTGVRMGADLLAFRTGNAEPYFITKIGGNNPLNNGFRNMESTGRGLVLGTANANNLLTDPESPLGLGGWELVRLVEDRVGTQSMASASDEAFASEDDWWHLALPLHQPFGQPIGNADTDDDDKSENSSWLIFPNVAFL